MPVYIIQGEEGSPVKIGWATNAKKRLQALQNAQAEPLRVLRLIEGIQPLEKAFHRHFKEHRIRGEWFRLHPDMLTIDISLPSVEEAAQLRPERAAPRLRDEPYIPPVTAVDLEPVPTEEEVARWYQPDREELGTYTRACKAARHYRELRELIASRRSAEIPKAA